MNHITQGTIISGLRSKKYKNQECYGIIISARCDLANEKIEKIFYLIAVSLDDWILSDEGFNIIFNQVVSNHENKLKSFSQKNELSWNDLKGFSIQEFEQIINDLNTKSKNKDDIIKIFKDYTYYTTQQFSINQKKTLLKNSIRVAESTCMEIISGKHTHYSFIPESAYCNTPHDGMGIIIDHQELDYIDLPTIRLIDGFKMDSLYLSQDQNKIYNNKFHLLNEPGFSMPLNNIESPWIEYVMQRFTNTFVRIGVDIPQKQKVCGVIERILNREEE